MKRFDRTRQKRRPNSSAGVTMIEALVVCILTAILAWALFPLIKSSWDSWMQADRMTELMQFSRVGMDRAMRDIRQSYAAADVTDPTYYSYEIEKDNKALYAPIATDTVKWDSSNNDLKIGRATGPQALARPIDQFTYMTTDRTQSNSTTLYRINGVELRFRAEDEVRNIDDVTVWSKVVPRPEREGYVLSEQNDFSVDETFFYSTHTFRIIAWSDQIDITDINQAYFQLGFGATTIQTNLTDRGDGKFYGEVCPVTLSGPTRVNIILNDNSGEQFQGTDGVYLNGCGAGKTPNAATCTCD